MEGQNVIKRGYNFWLDEKLSDKINDHLQTADLKNRSEFVTEAVNRYCCELDSEDNKSYLSKELVDVIQANIKNAEKHIATTIFKLAGEQATLNLLIADHIINVADEATARAYRNEGYDIVRKRQGVFTFEDAMKNAKKVLEEDE